MHSISGIITYYSPHKQSYTLFTKEYGKVIGYIKSYNRSKTHLQIGSLIIGQIESKDLSKRYLTIHNPELINICKAEDYESYLLINFSFFLVNNIVLEQSSSESAWALLRQIIENTQEPPSPYSEHFIISLIYYIGILNPQSTLHNCVVDEKNLTNWAFFKKKLSCKKKYNHSILSDIQHADTHKTYEKKFTKLVHEMEKYGLL